MEKVIMSGSPEFIEFSGHKAAAAAAAATAGKFSQTCSLLSQYLKEKGSFRELSLGMTCNNNVEGNGNGSPEIKRQNVTTMNLFPITDKAANVSGQNWNLRSMDLFPQDAGLTHSTSKEDVEKRLDSSVNKNATTEPQTAQMTIFYAGQVIVFDEFPAEKFKEIRSLASNGISKSQTAIPFVPAKSPSTFNPNLVKTSTESSSSIPPSPSAIPSFGNNLIQEHIQPPRQPIATDLPIARRASLHRFLEKRKDRLTAKAPYQTSSPSAYSSKPADSKPWLGLAAQSLQQHY